MPRTPLFFFYLKIPCTKKIFSLKKKKGFVGFAVVIHNFAELYLIRNALLGKNPIRPSFEDVMVCYLYVFLKKLLGLLENVFLFSDIEINSNTYVWSTITLRNVKKIQLDMPQNEQGDSKQPDTNKPKSLEIELELAAGNAISHREMVSNALSAFFFLNEKTSKCV
ncbi:hypothetical protein RFI_29032 [Reticulomyxa filosa]|uniref:Uncharacterized protein n=1 Tax=Reticulomyxa filosa TaxID=46433 RepID=X6M4G5_RETFI|nr:hypothetical protein RFI_29032 [Reticulomyxa filosa]|eukprot:ETO08357.1 hypothetical protein RFI_29032 [Reticulomyxa filosa]